VKAGKDGVSFGDQSSYTSPEMSLPDDPGPAREATSRSSSNDSLTEINPPGHAAEHQPTVSFTLHSEQPGQPDSTLETSEESGPVLSPFQCGSSHERLAHGAEIAR
jgi:hypothetical protein